MRAVVVAVAALVLAAPAAAGGWATAGLGPPPGGLGAGETWNAEVTILQHGVTPLEGVQPTLIIRNDRGVVRRFPAKPTGEPGVYAAKVKFPSTGTWQYQVDDGFSRTHSFAPVQIGPSTGGTSIPVWPFVLAGVLALVLALLAVARRLRPVAAPAAQP
jgi:hypothetical protein